MGDYADRFNALEEERRNAPPAGQPDLRGNNLEAFAKGFARGGTVGWSDKIEASIPSGGETYADRKAATFDRNRALAEQNPVLNFTGEALGFMLPSSLAMKGAAVAGKAIPFLGNIAAKSDTIVGRTLKAMGVGAGEGASYAIGQDTSPAKGALIGVVGAGAGQMLLGEALPGVYRYLGGKTGKKGQAKIDYKAQQEVKGILRRNNPNMSDDEIAAQMTGILEELGPNALVSDLDEALYKAGLHMTRNARDLDNAQNWVRTVKNRYQAVPERFNAAINRLTNHGGVMSPEAIADAAARDFKTYQPEFQRITQTGALQVPPRKIRQFIDGSFGGRTFIDERTGLEMTEGVIGSAKEAHDRLVSMLTDLTTVRSSGKAAGGTVKIKPENVRLQARDLVKLRSEVDALYDSAVNPLSETFSKGRAKDLATLRTYLNNELGQLAGFKGVNANYADTRRVVNFYEMGKDFLNYKKDPKDYTTLMSTSAPWEQEAFLEAVKYDIYRKMSRAKGQEKLIREFGMNGDIRKKLNVLVGPDLANEIIDAASDYARFGAKDKAVVRSMSVGASTNSTHVGETVADVAIAGAGAFSPGVSRAAGLGAGRRLISKAQGTAPRVDRSIMDILSEQGPEAVMRLMGEGNLPLGPSASDYLPFAVTGGALSTQGKE